MSRFLLAVLAAWLVVCGAQAQGMSRPAISEPTFPPMSRPWTLAEVNQAAVVLHRTAQMQPGDLPHYSIGSQNPFSRLVAPGVLENAEARTAEQRLVYRNRVVRLYEQILLIYARVHARQGGYDVEVAEVAGLLLNASARMAQDLEEARAEVADTSRAAFAEGEARLADGMVQMMRGVLEMASDADALSLNARQRLLLYATRTAAPIARALSPEQRTVVTSQIDALLQRPDLRELEVDLRALQASFRP